MQSYVCVPCILSYFFIFIFRVIKFTIRRKVGIYIATKLFQFTSHKEPCAIQVGPDGFFWPCSGHRVRPSYRDFFNSFAMKATGHMINSNSGSNN